MMQRGRTADSFREVAGRYELRLERILDHPVDRVWAAITEARHFGQWYPFQPRDFDLAVGNSITLVDEEGNAYSGTVTEFDPPRVFAFSEEKELLRLELEPDERGCRLILTHTFDDRAMAARSAAGWDGCLAVLAQVAGDEPIVWPEDRDLARTAYAEAFGVPE